MKLEEDQTTTQALPADDIVDINDAFDTTDTAELQMLNQRTGEKTSWVWTIAGPGHDVTVKQTNALTRERLALDRQRENARVNQKKWKEPVVDVDEERRKNASYFAERVLGWSKVRLNGEDYPFSKENCLKLLLDPKKPGIFNQLTEFFRSDDAFIASSAKT